MYSQSRFTKFPKTSACAAAILLASLASSFAAPPDPLPAFRGAQGFGALATGGRGGEVYHVTSLEDAGPGSLRDAVSKEKRIVVFDVGGCIEIKSPLQVFSNITLAGQSAPGQGITVYGDSVSFSEQQNVVVRYMRFRQGIESGKGSKAVNITSGTNMIFDHISAQWGRWDTLGVTKNSKDITFQDSVSGEAIDPQRFGGFVDTGTNVTLCRNLWMDNQSRNPKAKAHMQYINNVVYNWGGSGVTGGHSSAVWNQDMINNLFIKGPSSSEHFLELFAATDHVYQTGNIVDLDADGVLNGRPVEEADFRGKEAPTFQPKPFNTPPVEVPVLSVQEAYKKIVAGAGASLVRDEVDTRLIKQLTSLGKEGAIIRSEAEVGGQPKVAETKRPENFDTDHDGIPDDWEKAHGLNPSDPADGAKVSNDGGYTNVEIYLDSLIPTQP